jgi:hypothetical protein
MTREIQYFINVENSSGARLGSGPITSAQYWRSTFSMDQAGMFETAIPLADPAAAQLANERVLRCFAVLQDGVTEVGSGVIDDIKYIQSSQGTIAEIRGLDDCRFLADRSVQFLALGGTGSPPTVSHATCISSIATYAPVGWTFNADPSPPFDEIIYRFRGQSVLRALSDIAEFTKTHWYLSAPKTITFLSDFVSSGITAIRHPPFGTNQDPDTVQISQFSYAKETRDIMSRVYPYGGWYNGVFSDYFIPGVNEVNYDLDPIDPDYWPSPKYSGYTDNRTDNWIEKDSTVAAFGRRERYMQWQQVKVTFFTGGYSDEIWRDLCRLVYNRAVAELDWYGVEGEFYTLHLADCHTVLRPLQYVRVMIDSIENNRQVFKFDQNMLILQSTVEVTRHGIHTTKVEVTNAERYRRMDPYTVIPFQNLAFNDQFT